MTVGNQADIDGVKQAGRVVANVRDAMLAAIEPGMTTKELDHLGRVLPEEAGVISAPESTCEFPGASCISINEEAAHGIPGSRIMPAGDVVNVDVSPELNGYFAGTGATMVVPPVYRTKTRSCHATGTALNCAVDEANTDAPITRSAKPFSL